MTAISSLGATAFPALESTSPPHADGLLASNQLKRNVARTTLEGAPINVQQMRSEGYTRAVAFWVNKNMSNGGLKVAEMLINSKGEKVRFLRTNNEFDVRRGPSYSEPQKTTFQQAEAWFRTDKDRDGFVQDVLMNPAYRSAFTTGQRVNLNSPSAWKNAADAGALTLTGQVMYEIYKAIRGGGAQGI